jgi:hypothetical protein
MVTPPSNPKRKRGRPPGRRVVKPAVNPTEAAAAAAPAPVKMKLTRFNVPLSERAAWDVSEFCVVSGVSRSTYYNLKRKGEGPRETHVGTKILITRESAAAWLRKQEKQSSA